MYTFKNISVPASPAAPGTMSVPPEHTKLPNTIDGQPFDIADCNNATLLVLDNTDQVQIDNVVGSRIFVAASSESIFVRDCKDCTFVVACKQLRTRDCTNCTFYLYSKVRRGRRLAYSPPPIQVRLDCSNASTSLSPARFACGRRNQSSRRAAE
jgi:hypothetical protein